MATVEGEDMRPTAPSFTSTLSQSVDKASLSHYDEKQVPPTRSEEKRFYDDLAAKHGVNRTWLQWKMDLWIILPICLLYLLAFLDRVNISNANAYGMGEDIGLKGQQFEIALAIFFVPYVVFEIPANWLLKALSPHIFLPLCLIGFGCINIGQGFVRNYHDLIVTRVLLGLMETAMFPACFYLLASWYTRAEAQKRYSFFFCSTSLAGAFGGLIAYGCNNFHDRFGIAGWQWLFIVEGAITAFCGLLLFFLIADFPEQAKFLKPNELAYVKEKLILDQGDAKFEHKVGLSDIASAFKDWKTYMAAFMYFGQVVGAYGYAYFSVAIIKTFGYSPVQVQIHSIYPWICAFGASMIFAICSDYTRHRYAYTLVLAIIAIVGFAILLGTDASLENRHARYAACFLIATGLYSGMPLIICWNNMNLSGHARKMTVSAFQVGFGNIGGIISPFAYAKNNTAYTQGNGVSLGLLGFSMITCAIYFVGIMKENRDRDNGKGVEEFNQLSEKEKEASGDQNPSFRYMY